MRLPCSIDPISDLYAKLSLKKIPALDGIRAVAIGLVLCYHFDFPPHVPGPMGVTIFFILSGFLITWLLLNESERTGTVSLRGFYKRRALRILPAFYCYWLLSIVILLTAHRSIPWAEFRSTALYFSNYYYSFASPARPFMPFTWSLAVEEQFYFLWPALFLLYRRDLKKLSRLILVLIVSAWVYRAVLYFGFSASEEYLQHSFDTRVDHLLVGALLAVWLKRRIGLKYFEIACRNSFMPAITVCLLTCSVIAETLITKFDYRHTIGYIVEPPLIATFLVQMIVCGSVGAWSWINWRTVRLIGVLSYSIYLYHFSTGRLLNQLMSGFHWRYQLAAKFLGSVVVAGASYFLVERNFLKLKNKAPARLTWPQTNSIAERVAQGAQGSGL